MDEDKSIKFRKRIRMLSKILSYTLIVILMIIASFLVFFVIDSKLSHKKGVNPMFGLYTIVSSSMHPNINMYDVILIKNVDTNELKIGDVITFESTNVFFGGTPITHRIVEVININNNERVFRVKGDANATYDKELVISENVLGKAILRLPNLGKIQYFLTSKKGWFCVVLLPLLIIMLYDIYKIYKLIRLKKELEDMQI